jgi:hypothetical protein
MTGNGLNKGLVALNLLLLAAVIILAASRSKTVEQPPSAISNGSAPTNEVFVASTTQQFKSFKDLATMADWRRWIDQLRNVGVPEATLARLVQGDFDDRWQKRQSEAQSAYNHGEIDSDALAKLDLEHQVEQEKELRAALGEEGFKNWDKHRLLQELNLKEIDLTDTENDSIYALKKKLEEHLRDLDKQKLDGGIDQASLTDQQQKAQADYDQQLKTLLGGDRYATVQGLENPAGDLRRQLRNGNLAVDDTQFAAILEAQSNWNNSRAELQEQEAQTHDSSIEGQLKALDTVRDETYQEILGTNGFEEFQKQQDSRYAEMKRYADTWGINNTDIDYVFHTVQSYEKSVQDYQHQEYLLNSQGQSVDWDAVSKKIQQLTQQTENSLREYLGDDRFDKIKQNGIIRFN